MKLSTVATLTLGVIVGAAGVSMIGSSFAQPSDQTKATQDALKRAQEATDKIGKEAMQKAQDALKQPAGEEDPYAMMAKMAMPGEQHEQMKHFVGKWKGRVVSMDPSGQEMTSDGVAEFTMELDGRILVQKWEGSWAGQPFKGYGVMGYDNMEKKYFSQWTDTASTNWMRTTGSFSAASKTFAMSGTMPMMGQEMPVRDETVIKSADEHVMKMWMTGPDGNEMEAMTITYTRMK
jgi:hypothetical protein